MIINNYAFGIQKESYALQTQMLNSYWWLSCASCMFHSKGPMSLCGFSAKNTWPESNNEKISDKPKLKDILENTWPLLFKNVKVMKDKKKYKLIERLRNCSWLKNSKETWELNASSGSGLDHRSDLFFLMRETVIFE